MTFSDEGGPEMVVLPDGEFRMGGNKYDDREKLVHRVVIAKPFAIGRFAVTFEEFELFVRASGYEHDLDDAGWGTFERPVINVSWEDAKAYCQWLSVVTGQRYRLPSEAEWEYAARAGTTTAYYWGNAPGQNHANFRESGSAWSGEKTARVGSFDPNPWGLYNMLGNVSEWCEDGWHDNYEGAPTDGSVWWGGTTDRRVLRGGSWQGFDRCACSGYRGNAEPGSRSNHVGFRLARTL